MLHSFTLTDGRLFLDLTDEPESLVLTVENGRIRAVLSEDGQAHDDASWKYEDVKKIAINGRGGNDFIKLADAIKQSATIGGSSGNDTIYGGGGDDYIAGTDGNDFLDGGRGADTMIGGGGYDIVSYETRTKSVFVYQNGQSNDGEVGEEDKVEGDITEIRGGSGNDMLRAGNYGSAGTPGNRLVGGDGNDTLNGGARGDTLVGGEGNDRIDGGKGDDRIEGGSGADRLVGGRDRDTIYGDGGKDTIYGGAGIDKLYGGAGDDTFYIADGYRDRVDGGSGKDILKDKKDATDELISIVV